LDCLINNAIAGVLDYGQVMDCLKNYKAPHRKITTMLAKGELIRVKKGLYVLGEHYRTEPICRELLANLIFGPSYISQEFALSFYGMIPERVELVTSMTTKRNKQFTTPVGNFQYTYINTSRYTVGIDWLAVRKNFHILIASPEKALIDTISRYRDVTTQADMLDLLFEDLRIDESMLSHLDHDRCQKIAKNYRHPTVTLLVTTLQELS